MTECIICGNNTFKLKFHYLKKPDQETDFRIKKKIMRDFMWNVKNVYIYIL